MDSSSNPSQGSRAYIGLGANLGDALGALQAAVERLHALGRVAGASSVYETEPVGYTDQPPFTNAVVALDTELDPERLLAALHEIEAGMGRERTIPASISCSAASSRSGSSSVSSATTALVNGGWSV